MTAPLLMTKVYIPAPGKQQVPRPRLVEKLNQCLEPNCRLALISAPAGFGKTTLISAWVAALQGASAGQKVAWLSIDEGDNDPVIFWSYVITALQAQQAGVGQQALELLAAQGGELVRKLAPLLNDLAQDPRPCVLVLDDYHLIRSTPIHQSLAFFIEHAPPHIHLMIASRTDPPLPLALMRGRGRLLEIRLNELRFSDDEADAYLNAGSGLNLAASSVQALNHKTEGWIAGLQMATLAMKAVSLPDPKKTAEFVASFSGSNRFILDYLIEEVLNRQPEPVQQFLVQTAILDRLCGPLCDALLEGSGAAGDAQSVLEQLENSNLFIVPLDDQRYWYRYHQLFADLLRKRLAQSATEGIRELHRRAVQWYEQNGLIPSAIQHAFQLRDFSKAAALVAQVTEAMWGRGEHATLLAWMDALPDEDKVRYPHMLTFQVSMLISAGKLKEAEVCVRTLEAHIAAALDSGAYPDGSPEKSALIGRIAELRTYIASFYTDWQGVFDHAKVALANLTREEDAGKRCGVLLVLGNAHLMEGDPAAAGQAVEEAIAAGKRAGRVHMALSSMANFARVQWLRGKLNRAAQVCQEGLALVEEHHLERSTTAVELSLVWGSVLCERGALEEAEPFILRALDLAQEQQFIWQSATGCQAKARLCMAQGNLAEAEAAAQAGVEWCQSHQVPSYIASPGAALLAEIWLRQGKTARAARSLQERQITPEGELEFPRQEEYLALARLLWMQSDARGAERLLERIAGWAEQKALTGVQVAALRLRALVSHAAGDTEQALRVLGQALELARPEGYAQTFAQEGEAMRALLQKAVQRNISAEYASHLLSAGQRLPHLEETASPPTAEPEPRKAASGDIFPLVEPLSKREMETLRLIAEGLSNKEIAQKMSISLRTVKFYSTGIYNKLGVDSRMQAVNRARELGLL